MQGRVSSLPGDALGRGHELFECQGARGIHATEGRVGGAGHRRLCQGKVQAGPRVPRNADGLTKSRPAGLAASWPARASRGIQKGLTAINIPGGSGYYDVAGVSCRAARCPVILKQRAGGCYEL